MQDLLDQFNIGWKNIASQISQNINMNLIKPALITGYIKETMRPYFLSDPSISISKLNPVEV